MFTRIIIFLLVTLAGIGLSLQIAWNARLRESTGSPVLTTIISVLVTLLTLAVVWASGMTSRGSIPSFNALPKWAWCGGIFGAYYLVAALVAVPRVGTAAVFSLVIAGQMGAALVLDSTGAFGVTQVSLSPTRLLGTALLLIGVILIQRH